MKLSFIICLLASALLSAQTPSLQVQPPVRFLALGDSYTIGQSVAATDRWPVQLEDSLVSRGIAVDTLRIIATTGWRTDNLLAAITNQGLVHQHYNLVSLLIGVNNQYQGTPIAQYKTEFPQLLDSAIAYAGGDTGHVFVVSIPDYAYTPFGQGTGNAAQISAEIDQYNAINRHITDSLHIAYFDITPISRQGLSQPALVAGDGLHPSSMQYSEWVYLMLQSITTGVVTGIPGDAFKNAVVYPNPVSNELTIDFGTPLKEAATIELYNSSGALVRKEMISQSLSTRSLKALPAGLYTLRLSCGGGQTIKRIVKE